MQFTSALYAATALFSLAAANAVEFVNQDSTTRNIVFTANSGLESIDSVVIQGYGTSNVSFPINWIGNFYTYDEGSEDLAGILGEVRFNGYAEATYFDVSAIVNPLAAAGVKMLFPKNSNTPVSGCQTWPCSNAYNAPDDVATLSTDDDTLVCLLGNLDTSTRRNIARMPREFVES